MTKYPWKRLWCKKGGTYQDDSHGFPLEKSDDDFLHGWNTDVCRFEDVATLPVLVLLGEPGIGKTTTVRELVLQYRASGETVLHITANTCASLESLGNEIFGSNEWKRWEEGGCALHLFLDSLDEGRLFLQANIDSFLAGQFQRRVGEAAAARLFLRLVCRTADWAATLEKAIREIWNASGEAEGQRMAILELIPLTRTDVAIAAEANEINPETFIDALVKLGLVPLATRPVTLNMLLGQFRATGNLPQTRSEAYKQGCGFLAAETSEVRKDSNKTGEYTASQRVAVAARIAVITLISRIRTFSLGGAAAEGELSINEIVGGTETANGQPFEVTKTAVEEALKSALFTGNGNQKLVWAHQTYAEFLAADYIHAKRDAWERVLPLITGCVNGERKVVPEFHELAAWLASMNPEIFKELLKTEPDILLRCDAATAGAQGRSALVDALLQGFEAGEFEDCWQYRDYLHKLAHPGLAAQLGSYISDKNRTNEARHAAVETARACGLGELADTLFKAALDPSESYSLRMAAVFALAQLTPGERLKELIPLVYATRAEDPNDELRGMVLRTLWPNYLPAIDLFRALGSPRRSNFVGWYRVFLREELCNGLTSDTLPMALRWARALRTSRDRYMRMAELADQIILKSLQVSATPAILEELAALLHDRKTRHIYPMNHGAAGAELLATWLKEDSPRRHQLLWHIHDHAVHDNEHGRHVVDYLVQREDFPFVVAQVEAATREHSKGFWARCIYAALDDKNTLQIEAVKELYSRHTAVARAFRGWFTAVTLGSEDARWMREAHENKNRQPPKVVKKELALASIHGLLERLEKGDFHAWGVLESHLLLEDDDEHSEIRARKAWAVLPPETKDAFYCACIAYIRATDPDVPAWRFSGRVYTRAIVGVKAFGFAGQVNTDAFDGLDLADWRRWCPAIISLSIFGSRVDELAPTLARAAKALPAEFVDALLSEVRHDPERFGGYYLNRISEIAWNAEAAEAMIAAAIAEDCPAQDFKAFLNCLMEREQSRAIQIAEQSLRETSGEQSRDERAVEAAILLLNRGEVESWNAVWGFLSQSGERRRRVLPQLGGRDWRLEPAKLVRFTAAQLACLYRAALDLFPPKPRPAPSQIMEKTDRELEIRDLLLNTLMQNVTPDTCAEIAALAEDYPQYPGLKDRLREAIRACRSKSWTPVPPKDLMVYLEDPCRYLVRDKDDLMNLVLASLTQLQVKISTREPGPQVLWNVDPPGTRKVTQTRPKDEKILSDYIVSQLEDDLVKYGIALTREPEVRRDRKSDILVTAVLEHPPVREFNQLQMIIEVKGTWHRELFEIQSQLVDRYMAPAGLTHGIYLAGLFQSSHWDETDYKKRDTERNLNGMSRDALLDKLAAEASRCSDNGRTIRAFVLDASIP